MQELWKDIKGYEGIYQVSNLGRIKSFDKWVRYGRGVRLIKGKILSEHNKENQYKTVILCDSNGKGKTHRTHRLVAEAFIKNPECYPQVNHIDENKTNNCVDNLEWCTSLYNVNYGSRSEKQSFKRGTHVVQLDTDGNVLKVWNSISKVSKAIGACKKHLSKNLKLGAYSCKGYIWDYEERLYTQTTRIRL